MTPRLKGNPLYKWRQRNKKTRWDVAVALGLRSVTTIYHWETATTRPADPLLNKLAGVMETPAEELHRSWDRWIKPRKAAKK